MSLECSRDATGLSFVFAGHWCFFGGDAYLASLLYTPSLLEPGSLSWDLGRRAGGLCLCVCWRNSKIQL